MRKIRKGKHVQRECANRDISEAASKHHGISKRIKELLVGSVMILEMRVSTRTLFRLLRHTNTGKGALYIFNSLFS